LIVGGLAPLVKIKHRYLFRYDCNHSKVVSQCKKLTGESGGFALRCKVKRPEFEHSRCVAMAMTALIIGKRCYAQMLRTFV
jgi:hypothetical protein